MSKKLQLKIGLFVTCLVDLFRPQVGFAAVKLLKDMDCQVVVPPEQTCCGQPAYNSGDRHGTKQIAQQVIETFEDFDYVVVPSGSCAGMLHKHYPKLFADDAEMLPKAQNLASRTHELISFLVDVLGMQDVNAWYPHAITYHDSCSGLRELGIKKQPRKLLHSVSGLKLHELSDAEVCCGFGGTFCVKYSDISNKMVSNKTACIQSTQAQTLLAGDLGCLMNMAGKLQREGSSVKVFHIAEVLANMADGPGIGEAR